MSECGIDIVSHVRETLTLIFLYPFRVRKIRCFNFYKLIIVQDKTYYCALQVAYCLICCIGNRQRNLCTTVNYFNQMRL